MAELKKTPRGGRRRGAGGQSTGKTRITRKAQAAAKTKAAKDGLLLPHDILLRAANGLSFTQKKLIITYYKDGPNKGFEKSREWIEEEYWPTVQEQIDAAKAAAPYYVPRLAAQTIDTGKNTTDALSAVLKELSGKLPG